MQSHNCSISVSTRKIRQISARKLLSITLSIKSKILSSDRKSEHKINFSNAFRTIKKESSKTPIMLPFINSQYTKKQNKREKATHLYMKGYKQLIIN